MAGGAVLGVDRGAVGVCIACAGERQHMVSNCRDLRLLQDLVRPESRHGGVAGLLVLRPADAVADRQVDVLVGPAPEPVIVAQVRVARRACPACPMALRAIGAEDCGPAGLREIVQLGIGLDLLEVGSGDARHDILARRLVGLDRLGQLHPRGITQHPFGRRVDQRPGRIGDRVADAPDDGDVEGP